MSRDWSIWQDPAVAEAYTQSHRGGLLGAAAQLQTMIQLMSHVPRRPMRVMDLGTGDGVLLETILQNDPVELAVALDGSAAMLEKAKSRLADYVTRANTAVHFVQADLTSPGWREAVDTKRFDAIVSGFAIHHLEDDRKKSLYNEIFEMLEPGGVFVNVERVASASPLGEELYETASAASVTQSRQARGEGVTFEEVLRERRSRTDRESDRLAPVGLQLGWLREIGFVDVDCYWKHYGLAVLAGYRPR